MQAKLLVTADGGYRRGGIVPLKQISDDALDGSPSVENVLLVKREGLETPFNVVAGRDHWYHELMAQVSDTCPPRENDAEDLLFTLYTSGTTGKPKGIAHTTGGYLVGTYATAKWVFDLKEDDIYWCSADIGWGHRPQLPGLWAAAERRHLRDVRGRTRHPRPRPLLGHLRAAQGDRLLHRPDRHPRVHEVGPGARPEARPELAPAARLRRRAHQPGSLDVVLPPRRRGALPHRRHLVADRDREHPDHAAPRHHPAQAGLRLPAVPGPEAGHRDGERRAGRGGRGLPGPDPPLALDAAHHLRRPRPLRRHLLEPLGARRLRDRRRRQGGRGRLLLAARPRR